MMEKVEQISKFSVTAILEKKGDEEFAPTKKPASVGEWSGDELIIRSWPMDEIVDRVIQAGYNFKGAKGVENRCRKVLPALIKKDRNFTMSLIDIMNDKEVDKADMLDANVDEFIDEHRDVLKLFTEYRIK